MDGSGDRVRREVVGPERRALEVQAQVLKQALPKGVRVSFGEGRRRSDVAMALLKGDREAVLAVPPAIEDALDLDMHVMRSTHARGHFELLLVLTEPLEDQSVRLPERRAVLRSRLDSMPRDAEAEALLDRDGLN
ncbi:MAG TPA: hypothetical protein VFF08_07765 [Trueperaceae bacterium]|nr:hypothetical protein [Trueperaceae bacterium]